MARGGRNVVGLVTLSGYLRGVHTLNPRGQNYMLESTKIQRRQSEIRQALAELVGKEAPSDDETRSMESLDREYRQNETRYRAALVAEDTERREAGGELETREGRQWDEMLAGFELRQIALALDEGRSLDGPTGEIVTELRSQGGFRGIPVPLGALETRNTVAGGVPDPMQTMNIVDRLFVNTTVARMGGAIINIAQGEREYPVVSSQIAAGWAAVEGANVALADAFTTNDRALAPDNTFGVQLRVTRRALKQAGAGLESAMRRDLAGTIQTGLDRAAWQGIGANGEPAGVIPAAVAYGVQTTAVDAAATWAAFREAAVRFVLSNAAAGPSEARLMLRPETWAALDAAIFDAGSGITEWDRLRSQMGAAVVTPNALAAPAGDPLAATAVLTTTAGGLPPLFMVTWGAVDVIRDPYTDAQAGGLRLTGLVTADVTVARGSQVEILTGVR